EGSARLAASCARSTSALVEAVRGIHGLRIVGEPVGPLLAIAADESVPAAERVDPHHWADEVRTHGFLLQLQPGMTQPDGSVLPATTHITVTPVTESVLEDLAGALRAAADAVRGVPQAVAELPPVELTHLDSETAAAILGQFGLIGGDTALPDRLAPLLAVIQALPAPIAERLLTELLARLVEPRG